MDVRAAILMLLFMSPYRGHPQSTPLPTAPKGVFHGRLVLVPDANGRDMTLQEAFSYTDWESHILEAPAGFRSDGATIPRAAWSVIGGPWDGKYRAAAVVHDVGCDTHKYSWQITDRLFYEAMIDSDVPKAQALTMYYAVLVGGPHWNLIAAPVAESHEALEAKMSEIRDAAESAEQKKSSEAAHEKASINEKASISMLGASEKTSIVTSEEKVPVAVKTDVWQGIAAGKHKKYQGYVFSQEPTQNMSEDALKKVLAEAQQQEVAGHPLTPEDIEKKAKVDGFSQMTF